MKKHNASGSCHHQWRYLTSKLNNLLASGAFAHLAPTQQAKMVRSLRRLWQQMRQFQSHRQLRRALGLAAVLLGLGAGAPLQAQPAFAEPVQNPFALVPSQLFALSTFADLDGDGDLDIVCVEYDRGINPGDPNQRLVYLENQATNGTGPLFTSPVIDSAGVVLDVETVHASPTFGDLDGDGDLDMLISTILPDANPVLFFENTGTPTAPAFAAPVANAFGLNQNFDNNSAGVIRLADTDGDGDLDMLSGYYAYDYDNLVAVFGIGLFENTGTPTAPTFAPGQLHTTASPVGQINSLIFDVADIDSDGDLDILGTTNFAYSDFFQKLVFYENTGTTAAFSLAEPTLNPYSLNSNHLEGLFTPVLLGDLDQDGDVDVLIQNVYTSATATLNWYYYENTAMVGTRDRPEWAASARVFPAVSTGQYRLEVSSTAAQAFFTLRVVNASGQLLEQRQLPGATFLQVDLDLTNQPAGTYLVQLQSPTGQWVQRVVKQ